MKSDKKPGLDKKVTSESPKEWGASEKLGV